MLRTCTLAAGFAAAVLASPMAHAADDKTGAGSDCVPAHGNLPTGPRFFLVNSIFTNQSAADALRADCPIVKERIGTGLLNSSVFVIDNNPAADVRCELFRQQVVPNGLIGDVRGITRSSSGASTVTRQLNLGGLPGVPGTGSYWFIGCTLPPATSIVSYYVNEAP